MGSALRGRDDLGWLVLSGVWFGHCRARIEASCTGRSMLCNNPDVSLSIDHGSNSARVFSRSRCFGRNRLASETVGSSNAEGFQRAHEPDAIVASTDDRLFHRDDSDCLFGTSNDRHDQSSDHVD